MPDNVNVCLSDFQALQRAPARLDSGAAATSLSDDNQDEEAEDT